MLSDCKGKLCVIFVNRGGGVEIFIEFNINYCLKILFKLVIKEKFFITIKIFLKNIEWSNNYKMKDGFLVRLEIKWWLFWFSIV